MNSEPVRIRLYQPDDLDDLYRVCLLTADNGGDATALFRDPKLPGHVYAGPYAIFEPSLAFVAEDTAGVGGYVVAALDSQAFEQRLERDWWPALRRDYADLPDILDYLDLHSVADTIVSGGENVAPAEVEAVLEAHPEVLEAAVLGRADARWGEAGVGEGGPDGAPGAPTGARFLRTSTCTTLERPWLKLCRTEPASTVRPSSRRPDGRRESRPLPAS